MMQTLLSAVATTGAGSSFHLGDGKRITFLHKHAVMWYFTVGSGDAVTALTLALEGSLDGVHWFTLGTSSASADELTNQCGAFTIIDKLVEYVRANITTLTKTGSGGSHAVTVTYAPAFLRTSGA